MLERVQWKFSFRCLRFSVWGDVLSGPSAGEGQIYRYNRYKPFLTESEFYKEVLLQSEIQQAGEMITIVFKLYNTRNVFTKLWVWYRRVWVPMDVIFREAGGNVFTSSPKEKKVDQICKPDLARFYLPADMCHILLCPPSQRSLFAKHSFAG